MRRPTTARPAPANWQRGRAWHRPEAGRAGDVALVGLPFLWLGMVLAISFVETPLKFQAPGITVPLGLGIGRLVFGALNVLETGIAAALVVLALRRRSTVHRRVNFLLGWACGVLLVQIVVLRPVLDARTVQVIAGTPPPEAAWHLVYIALEVGKVALLAALGSASVLLNPPRPLKDAGPGRR